MALFCFGSDAYAAGNTALWQNGEQEAFPDRITVIAPPAEVGGGPQNRSFIARFRINQGDPAVAGSGTGQRAEVLTKIAQTTPFLCQGNEFWCAWETYFGNPSVVADTNAYRPRTNTIWNYFLQLHQAGGLTTPPWAIGVDARVGSASTWRFAAITRGGPETSPTVQIEHDCGPFSYGWHEYRMFVRFAQATGRMKIWVDNVLVSDYTGPVGYNPDGTGGVCNYVKQGMYRNNAGNVSPSSTVFGAGTRLGTTEADVLEGGGTDPPPDPAIVPDANVRDRRFGKATVGSGLSGFSADSKRGSKFATNLGTDEQADVKDVHIWIEGMDGSASTQKVTLGIYADDAGGGLPGTKLGEVDQEISVAGAAVADWVKVSPSSPIRVASSHAWLVAGSGAPANRLRYAFDSVANALAYGADTYEASAPRLANPFGSASLDAKELSICADYDIVPGMPDPPGDTTAPVLQSAFTTVSGDALIIGYDEPLLASSVPNPGDFVATVQGVNRSISSVTIAGSGVQLLLSTPVESGDTVLLDYNRAAGREIKDTAGNLAPSFVDFDVENQTSAGNPSFRLTTKVRVTSIARTVDPSKRIAGLGGGGI